jgi:hypothetical protein
MKLSPFSVMAAAFTLSHAVQAGIVYDHFTFHPPSGIVFCHDWQTSPAETASHIEIPGGSENISQAAQRLTLAGTDRFVTRLDMSGWAFGATAPGSGPVVADITAYLYADAGGVPSGLLWSGTATGIALNPTNSPTPGTVNVSYFPNVTLPNTVFLAFSHSNISNQRGFMGMTFSSSPGGGIGQAGQWLFKDTTTGLWNPPPLGSGDSLLARLTAVPAPGTLLLLAAGFMCPRRR